jgi:hypothetical protein
MRFIYFVIALLITCSVFGQRNITPTDTLFIRGKIQVEKKFSLAQLDSLPKKDIHDLVLYNQKGEIKDTVHDLKGVPLKTLLDGVTFLYDKPKELNAFYLVLIASDGYTVVLSWNEVYNTTVGDQFFIVTEMEGKRLSEMEERILFLSAGDLKPGRRYVHALDRIEVRRIE